MIDMFLRATALCRAAFLSPLPLQLMISWSSRTRVRGSRRLLPGRSRRLCWYEGSSRTLIRTWTVFFLRHVSALILLMGDTGASRGLAFGRSLMLCSMLTDMVSVLEGPWRATWEALSGLICQRVRLYL